MVSRAGQVHLDTTLAEAFRRSDNALVSIGAEVTTRVQAAGRLEAIFPLTWMSWGETVRVDILGVDGDVVVQVESATRFRLTFIDFGKNAKNVRSFLAAVNRP